MATVHEWSAEHFAVGVVAPLPIAAARWRGDDWPPGRYGSGDRGGRLSRRTRHPPGRRRPATGRGPSGPAVNDLGLVVVGLAIATGIVGVVVPVVPGGLLTWAAIAVWALAVSSATAWAVLAIATLVIGAAQVVKLLVPGRRLATRASLAGPSSLVCCSPSSASS